MRVVLDDLEPQVFDVFVDWLYTNKIPEDDEQWLSQKPDENRDIYDCRLNMLRLKAYVAADRLGAGNLLNAINNDYVDSKVGYCPWYEEVIYAFANIPPQRKIIRSMVAPHCRNSGQNDVNEFECQQKLQDGLPRDFLLQAMHYWQRMREEESWNEDFEPRNYHEHSTKDEKDDCRVCTQELPGSLNHILRLGVEGRRSAWAE